jgi:putative transposase
VKLIDEYMTSKTCCKCKNIKQDLKGEKIYNCSECNLVIDRDINAAINIYLL